MLTSLPRLGVSLFAILAMSSLQASAYLNIGDPAPPITAGQWYKGQPIGKFESGKVYVVEFWATWCTPCKANIPHLTQLAKQYRGKVQVTGVSIWESTDPTEKSYLKKVGKFVQSEGSKMDYTVAADVPEGTTAKSWMTAAGLQGIPASFIVGKDGKIAWIGYPLDLDNAVKQVLDGTFDMKSARDRRDLEMRVIHPIQEAMSGKQYGTAIRLIDAAVKAKPELERRYTYDRLVAQYHTAPAEAKAKSDAILQASNHEIGAYRMIVSILATEPGLSRPSYSYGLDLIQEALKLNEMNYLFLAMGCDVDENLGDHAGAVEMQTKAVAAAEIDSHAPADFVARMRKKLQSLKASSK